MRIGNCQLLLSVIRVFSDLTNKDLKKVNVGELLLPERVLQFLNPEPQQQQEPVNPEVSPSPTQPQFVNSEPIQSASQQPRTGGRIKHRAFKSSKSMHPATEVGVSKTSMPQSDGPSKKQRAKRPKSDNADEDSETDEETLHQRKRRLVAAHLFGASNVTAEAVNLDRVFEEHVSAEDEAPTSNADDVVEEATHEDADEAPEILVQEATENIEAEIFELQGFDMDVEAHNFVHSDHFEVFDETEGVEADHTVILEDSMATHTEILSVTHQVIEKGEEVDQTLNTDATENVAVHATETVQEIIAEIPVQEVVAENVENIAKTVANSDAKPDEENANDDDSSDHSQEELFESQANSDELREVNRATAEHFQEMYFSNWSNKDTIFSDERAADFVTKSSNEITNPELLTYLKATIIQVKSLNNRFDASDKVIEGLRNDIAARELTQQKDKSLYISLCKDQKVFDSRLSKVEDNQVKMSTKLDEIANSIELLTSVLLSDDVKKGERVPQDKCKSSQTLARKDDTTDGGAKGQNPRTRNVQRQGRRSNFDAQNADGKRLYTGGQSSSRAEEKLLAEEHRKDVEAGIYKQKVIKAPRRKENGIVIKENVNSDQSLQYSRRPVIKNVDKGKGKLVEEEQLPKKIYSTSDITQVETRLAKSTSDAAQVDVSTKVMTTSDVAQVVQKSTQLPGFSKPKILEELKLEAVNFSETRTVLGKEAFDKSGLGSHRERRTNNRSQDNISLAEPGIGVTQENLDKLESVQLIFHKVLKKQFLLYFMSDGRVYKVGESDVNLKSWEELEYVLYLLKVKNRHTHDVAQVLREKMLRSKAMLGGGVSSVYIPKYRDHTGKLVEMKRNSARFRTALGIKTLEFNLESDKSYFIRLGNDMRRNSIYSLRAAIYQTGESDSELKELKEIMVDELEKAERRLLIDYLRTVPDIEEVK
ncbi:hypothetical protein POM88_007568 [Heracleum sosnowskyi]|uniref:Uncharacterized protein n=1 Tax=Heracleum sosnowskyi TaxID=360622 RepID=A0AAD8J8C4_9APIA|nr:hypothetical protein POM88_007568 [Heracleum sosnowskyi]